MERFPYLRSADFGYENIIGTCGMCSRAVVVNRATDLGDANWADGMSFSCPFCKEIIGIRGETGNHAVDLFWMQESFLLYLDRRYMQAISVLAQAVEIALTLCARSVLLEQPISNDSSASPESVERLQNTFVARVPQLPLGALRTLLVNVATFAEFPSNVAAAEELFARLKKLQGRTAPSEDLAAISDQKVREAVQSLAAAKIIDLRNDVIHRHRRPKQAEVEQQREAVKILIRQVMTAFGVTPLGGQLIVGPPMSSA